MILNLLDAVSLPDVLLARTGSGTSFYNLSVLRQFEIMNVPTLPNSASIEASKDKMYANQILARAGLPIPAFHAKQNWFKRL